MPIKIAEIPYLNCAPFYWNKGIKNNSARSKENFFEWVPVSPKRMGQLARAGKIDAGPISLADSFQLEEDFEPLSDLGIAVKNSAKSVLLFSKKPIEKLAGCAIGLTPQTVTSSELLKFILEGKYGIEPKYHERFSPADEAQLRIGDEALKEVVKNSSSKHFKFVFDLGEEWSRWQNLPFVFARWMVRKDMDYDARLKLSEILMRNLTLSEKELSLALDWFEKKSGWNYVSAREYLKGFRYRLKEEEKKSISVFRRLLTGFAATICGC